ncbi:MAG TPA: fructosamine kinase family protein [Longimicrobiales bacterium]|nr:fructosamine kinase family protein [Longimicrobiales bacterium]
MGLPGGVAEPVRRALEEHGLGRRIERVEPVAGGCISHGARLATDAGASLFLKWNAAAPAGMFAAEADGLEALGAADALRVPAPIAWSDAPDDGSQVSWLLMEYVHPGPATPAAEERLGVGLAGVHASTASLGSGAIPTRTSAAVGGAFGWRRDNWIGSLPQANPPSPGWGHFWSEHRLRPQLERARAGGYLADRMLDGVLERTPAALADVVHPELVHGDLWGGNWFAAQGGEPVLIDPAVYLGHGEVDLAMSELFGGFGAGFYAAYRDAHGITEAYEAYRRDLYQLYYLLVHVNLFGASYEAGALRAARRVVAALSG